MVKYWMGAQCCLKYNRSVSVNHFPQLKVDSQKRFQKNIFQNQFPLVWKWVIFFFTREQETNCTGRVCVWRENPPSQQNIKSREQRRKENLFTWVMLHPCPKWVNLWKKSKNKLLVLLLNQVPQCMLLFFYLYHCEDQFEVAVRTFLETWGIRLGHAAVLVKVKGLPYSAEIQLQGMLACTPCV